jgi:hypothetical protein
VRQVGYLPELLHASCTLLVATCLPRRCLSATPIRLCPVLCRQISINLLRVLPKFSWSYCSYPVSLMRAEYTRLVLWLQMSRICELRLLWQIPRKLVCRYHSQGSILLNRSHLYISGRDRSVQSFLKCHHFGQPEVLTNYLHSRYFIWPPT